MPNVEHSIEDIQKQLPELDFEGKRLALGMLNITVWLDNDNVEITGTIDPEMSVTAITPYKEHRPALSKAAGRPPSDKPYRHARPVPG